MPRIRVNLDSFPRNNPWNLLNHRILIDVPLAELVHAAITVGHPDYSAVLGGGSFAAAYESIWKAASTLMTIQPGYPPRLSSYLMTGRFANLDPSEKRGATYQLGLTLNKLLAQRLFGVPWLRHFDVYAHQVTPRMSSSRSRPDLFGMDTAGNWYVFESKGRVSKPSLHACNRAKAQASRVVSINGIQPRLAASCFAFFRYLPRSDVRYLECLLEDPPIGDKGDMDNGNLKRHQVEASPDEFILNYYKTIHPLFADRAVREVDGFLEWNSPEFDLLIRYDVRIFRAVNDRAADGIREVVSDSFRESNVGPGVSIKDGIQVFPGERWKKLHQEYEE